MLVNNGRLVMQGFAKGMRTGFDTEVRRTVAGINGRLSRFVFNTGISTDAVSGEGGATIVNVTFNAPTDREGVAMEIRKLLDDYARKRS